MCRGKNTIQRFGLIKFIGVVIAFVSLNGLLIGLGLYFQIILIPLIGAFLECILGAWLILYSLFSTKNTQKDSNCQPNDRRDNPLKNGGESMNKVKIETCVVKQRNGESPDIVVIRHIYPPLRRNHKDSIEDIINKASRHQGNQTDRDVK